MAGDRHEDEQQRESRRILAHINAQTDGAAMSVVQRTAKRGRDHFAASDADESDWIELWGTRIGRGISLILFAALVLYFGVVVLSR